MDDRLGECLYETFGGSLNICLRSSLEVSLYRSLNGMIGEFEFVMYLGSLNGMIGEFVMYLGYFMNWQVLL